MQLRARLAHDDFTARPHFQSEYEAILQVSLPYKVTREDRLDPRAPTVAGKPLPTGAHKPHTKLIRVICFFLGPPLPSAFTSAEGNSPCFLAFARPFFLDFISSTVSSFSFGTV